MKREKYDKLMQILADKPPLPDEFIIEIEKHSFATGSNVFVVEDGKPFPIEFTDLDIVVHPDCKFNWEDAVNKFQCAMVADNTETEYFLSLDEFQSCYGIMDGRLINFLFMHSVEDFNTWKYATEKVIAMRMTHDSDVKTKLLDKDYRVGLFTHFKDEHEYLQKALWRLDRDLRNKQNRHVL